MNQNEMRAALTNAVSWRLTVLGGSPMDAIERRWATFCFPAIDALASALEQLDEANMDIEELAGGGY